VSKLLEYPVEVTGIRTGGQMHQITLSINQGGLCYTSGGIREVILSAGYMGSMFWGCLIFYGIYKADTPQEVTIISGALIMLLTVLTLRNGFGIFFGFAFGGGLIGAATLGSTGMNEVIVQLMAVTNVCYPLYDILDDVMFRTVPSSDAYRLGQLTGMASETWGFIWIVVSLVVLGVTLYLVTEPDKVIQIIED
jgi:hypothetical protein